MAGKEHVMAGESGTTSSGVTEESWDVIIPIESNNTPAGESGTTSSGVNEESRDIIIPIESNNTPANENAMNQSQTVTPKIQKVTIFLPYDSNFVRQYEPRLVSLGPIHHHNPKYQSGEGYNCKKRLTSDFVRDSGKELNVLYEQIKKIINQLRNCFMEEVTEGYDDNALALLLCEDGCAILQYIYCPPTLKMFDVIAQDILLLENQIPYKVLKELMQLSDNKEELEKAIATFIEESVTVRLDQQSKKKAAKGNRGDNLPSQANPQRDVQIDGDHVHLLDLLRTSLLGKSQAENLNKRRDLPPLPNVQVLKAAGIHLRRSSDSFLSNISFSRRFHLLGRLYLPPIIVNYPARLKFLNLVAYERCPGFKNDPGPGVISYLFFLCSLINEAQDVKELRDAGVLYSSLGSDTELQTLISEMCAKLGSDPDAYIGVKEKIQEYHGTLMSKMLRYYNAYIRDSNWPLIIILAQLLDLFSSVTQSWFAVKNWFSVSPASQSHS